MLKEFIQEVNAKRLTVMMDACYRNGAYSQIAGFRPAGGKSLGIKGEEGHGRSRQEMAHRLLWAKDVILEGASPLVGTPVRFPQWLGHGVHQRQRCRRTILGI